MDIKTEYFQTKKTARYATFGHLTHKTQFLWFAAHGSHMICEQMIYKFKEFDPETHFVIAPEGLSRFYAKGFSGEVVATWMTSRDRTFEIEDFSEYLGDLLTKFQSQTSANCKTILLGFSQGGTSIFRWLHRRKTVYDYLIAYSCWIPEDIDLTNSQSELDPIIYTYGLQDPFINDERIENLQMLLKSNQLKPTFHPYKGDHRIDKSQLKVIFEDYIS